MNQDRAPNRGSSTTVDRNEAVTTSPATIGRNARPELDRRKAQRQLKVVGKEQEDPEQPKADEPIAR